MHIIEIPITSHRSCWMIVVLKALSIDSLHLPEHQLNAAILAASKFPLLSATDKDFLCK